jgi:hypothetical protein
MSLSQGGWGWGVKLGVGVGGHVCEAGCPESLNEVPIPGGVNGGGKKKRNLECFLFLPFPLSREREEREISSAINLVWLSVVREKRVPPTPHRPSRVCCEPYPVSEC